MSHPDVVGLTWGSRMKKGRWQNGEDCLSIQVRLKRSVEHILAKLVLPREIEGVPTDVVEVGDNVAHKLDHCTTVRHGTISSSITHVLGDGPHAWTLLSGHGALWRSNTLQRSFRHSPGERVRNIKVYPEGEGVLYNGQLLAGACGDGTVDWAVARFISIGERAIDGWHLAAGQKGPLRLRTSSLHKNELVSHVSRLPGRPTRLRGEIRQVSVGGISLELPDGSRAIYQDVLVVSGYDNVPFSSPGDSGSLVVDAANRAVGMILGGSRSAGLSYVLRLNTLLADAVGQEFCRRFFR